MDDLIEAANRLKDKVSERGSYCLVCEVYATWLPAEQRYEVAHAEDCPVPRMPQIIKALEAAERFTQHMIHLSYAGNELGETNIYTCGGCGAWCPWDAAKIEHEPDCPGLALLAVLKGEEVRP